ncbi:up-regulator of cell proliferation-like [Discoglossus pictus]
MRDIGSEVLNMDALQETAHHFLQNIMMLDKSERSQNLGVCKHHHDLLCDFLSTSDNFLLQDILSKMTICQIAVPLLLPVAESQKCILMLWAMREIVKRWSYQKNIAIDKSTLTKGRVVNIQMPIFSFVRLGTCSFSKSNIINQVLSSDLQKNVYFVNRTRNGGNTPRKLSDGLVEIFWHFPDEAEHSSVFKIPFAIINLRGDLESHPIQFRFLTQVSSVIFIFSEMSQTDTCSILTHYKYWDVMYLLGVRKNMVDLKKNNKGQFYTESSFILKNPIDRDIDFITNVKSRIEEYLSKNPKCLSLQDMESRAISSGVEVDENYENCQKAKQNALKITKQIRGVEVYKNIHEDIGKQIVNTEKEYWRINQQGDPDTVAYRKTLKAEYLALREKLKQQVLNSDMSKFIKHIITSSPLKRQYFMKWMKYYLEPFTSQGKNKKNYFHISTLKRIFGETDAKEFHSFHGLEYYMHKLGQLYEVNNFTMQKLQEKHCAKLPRAVAELMLDGFPMELVDGNASNISLTWVTDVLTVLEKRASGRCRVRVISVVGVQSSGNSTLLNTMFGLQLPAASGRCTRGAFMNLIEVKKDFQIELGCDFILVIDTEGLKSPELASLEDSYEHDNELATLVVGLSDITIVNINNTEELKSILQIVIHAFVRLKLLRKKPNCHLVHHNVSDVSSHENLLKQLNEMTNAAAKIEGNDELRIFSDIMNYNPDQNNWNRELIWQDKGAVQSPKDPTESGTITEASSQAEGLCWKPQEERLQSSPGTPGARTPEKLTGASVQKGKE